jgi:hypothetical protein
LLKLSEFYTTKFMDSYLHLCRRGYQQDCVDANIVAVGTADVDEDPVALYFEYYGWSSSRQLYLSDFWIVYIFFIDIWYLACATRDTSFV